MSEGHDTNLAAIVEQHTIAQHDEHLRALPHECRERLFKCVQPSGLRPGQASTRAPGSASLIEVSRASIGRKVGIPKNANTREVRQRFLQQLKPFAADLVARIHS